MTRGTDVIDLVSDDDSEDDVEDDSEIGVIYIVSDAESGNGEDDERASDVLDLVSDETGDDPHAGHAEEDRDGQGETGYSIEFGVLPKRFFFERIPH